MTTENRKDVDVHTAPRSSVRKVTRIIPYKPLVTTCVALAIVFATATTSEAVQLNPFQIIITPIYNAPTSSWKYLVDPEAVLQFQGDFRWYDLDRLTYVSHTLNPKFENQGSSLGSVGRGVIKNIRGVAGPDGASGDMFEVVLYDQRHDPTDIPTFCFFDSDGPLGGESDDRFLLIESTEQILISDFGHHGPCPEPGAMALFALGAAAMAASNWRRRRR